MGAQRSADFSQPEIASVAAALRSGLVDHFEVVRVECVECPDLRNFGVASRGMCGSTALVEFGGEPFAHNPRYRGTNVSIQEMLDACGVREGKVFGAAMADAAAIGGHCGEMISNADPGSRDLSRVARVGDEGECVVERYTAPTCGPIANLFVSEGDRGEVVEIDVRGRIGGQFSLTQAMRESLAELARDDGHIGMGGVFELVAGRVRSHVMPDYECIAGGYYDTEREQVVRDFLRFYEHMGPGLLCFSALWTGDPDGGDLNLRPSGEHTHFHHRDDAMQQAGHYHGDVTPGEVHYRGYFNLAAKIVRFGNVYEDLGLKP